MAVTQGKEPTREERKTLLESMSVPERVAYHYEHGEGSIQDIARVYKLDVSEVLDIIGQGELKVVTASGDLIDAQEAGPGAQMQYSKDFYIPFTTD